MPNYKLHKSTGTVEIRAYLEDRSEGCSVAFNEYLNEHEARYYPVTLRLPDNIDAKVYTSVYDEVLLSTIHGVTGRLPVYTADGKRYAYIDYYERDRENGNEIGYSRDGRYVGRGQKIRIKIPVNYEGAGQ